jgi:ABC-2 type transport system ATP-binding protein
MKAQPAAPSNPVIELSGVSRRFGSKLALQNISLSVPAGKVFGLVGENGAGKTTLIKHILGLLKAQSGSVRVFGLDPVLHPPEVLSRIGYLSENRDLPAWMRVDELLHYTEAFYPKWDRAYAEKLRDEFALDPAARIKNLSRGETAKAGLLIALAYRPELLLLDEPSSGLDPLVRREILEAIIRTVTEEGRTVFFSSHLLDEIERVSDQIALVHAGRIVLAGDLDDVKEQHHRITIRFEQPLAEPPGLGGAMSIEGAGREWTAICNGARGELLEEVAQLGASVVEEHTPSLNEIFVARVRGKMSTND